MKKLIERMASQYKKLLNKINNQKENIAKLNLENQNLKTTQSKKKAIEIIELIR